MRHGSANVFFGVKPLADRYLNKVTETKSANEFGLFPVEIQQKYPEARKITLVSENFSSRTVKSVIVAFGEKERNRIWNRFDVYYTPKHGSWLNQAEIEMGMLSRQCLGHSRAGDIETLKKRTKAWNHYINRKKVKIQWNSTKDDPRETFNYGEKINPSDH